MSREHFEAVGKLYPCPNPRHEFSIGRMIGQWQWAKEAWSHMNDTGNLVTTWLGVSKTETPDGLCLVSVTIWKLCVIAGMKAGAGDTGQT